MVEKLREIGFSTLTMLEDALEKLFSQVNLTPIEEIKTINSLNRVLAEDITSKINIPPFDRSAMDGYALIAEDTFGASQRNPKTIRRVGLIEIGETSELNLSQGQGIRISTGAPIPKGADAVIKIEDTEIDENETITLYTPLVPGKNISQIGEDIKEGTEILKKGIELKPEHIALLISSGIETIKSRRKPRISVFASGDELIEVGNPLEPSKIYNSNTPMISNLVLLYGGSILKGETIKDDKEAIINTLRDSVGSSDIIILTGGTSVGTKDFLPEIIHEIGTVFTHGIAMRPGSPILIGRLGDTFIFCLPGTPVAAYIGFLKIVGPAIRKMMSCSILDPRLETKAIIDKDVPVSSMGFLNFLRVKIVRKNEQIVAIPIKLKGSGVISSLTESDGIVEIPPYQEGLKMGAPVNVKLYPR